MAGLPEELLEEVLLRLDLPTTLAAAGVCRLWCETLRGVRFWRRRLGRAGLLLPPQPDLSPALPLAFYQAILAAGRVPYLTNLLHNGSGELETSRDKRETGNRNLVDDFDEFWFQSWVTLSSGGSGWRLYSVPPFRLPASQALHSTYFATSNFSCTKEQVAPHTVSFISPHLVHCNVLSLQVVSLVRAGLAPQVLDCYQPEIRVEEWERCSPGHPGTYELEAALLDGCGRLIAHHQVRLAADQTWTRVHHTFQHYGPGARYLRLYHGGQSDGMVAGWEGPAMTGAAVTLELPSQKRGEEQWRCGCGAHHSVARRPNNLSIRNAYL